MAAHHLIKKQWARENPEDLARELAEIEAAGDTVDVIKSAKSSPLINQVANRARLGGPATQPLTSIGASQIGQQDVQPGQALDEIDWTTMHRHDGTPEGRTAYFHSHDHTAPVNADPSDGRPANYDTRQHLNDPRHERATECYETKGARGDVDSAIAALEADIHKTAHSFGDSRDFHMRQYSRGRIQRDAALIAKLVDAREIVRKAARADVLKAVTVDSGYAVTPELTKIVQSAVNKAFEDLGSRIDALNERAPRRQ